MNYIKIFTNDLPCQAEYKELYNIIYILGPRKSKYDDNKEDQDAPFGISDEPSATPFSILHKW